MMEMCEAVEEAKDSQSLKEIQFQVCFRIGNQGNFTVIVAIFLPVVRISC
jgi:hypothetical protein